MRLPCASAGECAITLPSARTSCRSCPERAPTTYTCPTLPTARNGAPRALLRSSFTRWSAPAPTGSKPRTRLPGRCAAAVGIALALMTTVVLVASPAASATVTNVSLRPDRYWTATGVVLRSGDLLTISATGQMHFGPAPIDRVAPPGLGRKCPSPVPGLHWPAPDLTCWSLVARIGAAAPFEVGARTTLQVGEGGALSLGINDDN